MKTFGDNRSDFSYPDIMLRKLWTEMKVHAYFGESKKGRNERDIISHIIVEKRQDKGRSSTPLYPPVLTLWKEIL